MSPTTRSSTFVLAGRVDDEQVPSRSQVRPSTSWKPDAYDQRRGAVAPACRPWSSAGSCRPGSSRLAACWPICRRRRSPRRASRPGRTRGRRRCRWRPCGMPVTITFGVPSPPTRSAAIRLSVAGRVVDVHRRVGVVVRRHGDAEQAAVAGGGQPGTVRESGDGQARRTVCGSPTLTILPVLPLGDQAGAVRQERDAPGRGQVAGDHVGRGGRVVACRCAGRGCARSRQLRRCAALIRRRRSERACGHRAGRRCRACQRGRRHAYASPTHLARLAAAAVSGRGWTSRSSVLSDLVKVWIPYPYQLERFRRSPDRPGDLPVTGGDAVGPGRRRVLDSAVPVRTVGHHAAGPDAEPQSGPAADRRRGRVGRPGAGRCGALRRAGRAHVVDGRVGADADPVLPAADSGVRRAQAAGDWDQSADADSRTHRQAGADRRRRCDR